MGEFAELTQLLEALLLDQELDEFKELLEPRPKASITFSNKTTTFGLKSTGSGTQGTSGMPRVVSVLCVYLPLAVVLCVCG